jgi:hypothetical protein
MLLLIVTAGVSLSASAQIYVKVGPVVPVIVQTERPGRTHIYNFLI